MINNSNPIKWGFFAYDKHFLAMIRRAEKLTTNIGSYLSDFAIKTCTEAASVHASVHHYDSDDDDDDDDSEEEDNLFNKALITTIWPLVEAKHDRKTFAISLNPLKSKYLNRY